MIFQVYENKDYSVKRDDSVATLYLRKNIDGSVDLMSGHFTLGVFRDDYFSIVDNGFKYSGIRFV